ncbi:MAG: divalent metal cation transporter [Allomuricauda sp.]|nr:MAG: divalent metal cation transporter [Allomuricauda sp.]
MKKIGPGVLIAAAFIGPGTVTVCTLAGVNFGYSLLWAMLISILATIILQEMASRLGIVTQKGLGSAISTEIKNKALKIVVVGIVLGAILIGNAAYEAGNIGGAVLGVEAIFGAEYKVFYPFLIGILAFFLLWFGTYKILEKVFLVLIGLMSISFLLTAILTKPNLIELVQGIFVPKLPEGSVLTIIALIGTTVVPYNLFLHAALVSEKWKLVEDLKWVRRDTVISIGFGGLISMAIIIAASAITVDDVNGASDLAKGLEPLFGDLAVYCMGAGLFAAGVTSSITAPLAAAFVASSFFGWGRNLKDIRFRITWIVILVVGTFSLFFNVRPIEVIQFAQVANGLLLPVIAIILIWMVNKANLMGKHRNSSLQNVFGILIVLLALALGSKSILSVFGSF